MLKKCLFILPLLLFFALTPPMASAAEDEAFFAEHDWDELAAMVLEESRADEYTVALGYCNTVTGEEHYFNGDEYFSGASLYKLPLNMYCAEQILSGERDWSTETLGRPYEEIQVSSLTFSNNPLSLQLVHELGGWETFRSLIAPYMGEDSSNESFTEKTTLFTARQMTRCTALLATESDRFPRVIDCLLDSAPDSFLNYADVPYDVAQKYGNNMEEGNVFHVAGIVYTEDPIVLVILTRNLAAQRTVMARYCELMCGYTNYQRTLRLEAEQEAQRLAEEAEREARRLAEEAEQAAAQKAAEEEAARLAQEAEAQRLAEEEAIREAADSLAAERAAAQKKTLHFIGIAALSLCGIIAAILIFHKRK